MAAALDRLQSRQIRYVRTGVGLVGGAAAGWLLAGEQYLAGAGLAVATLLVTFVLPRLTARPVTDERTEAIERWASGAALRVTCCSYVGAIVGGAVALASGRLTSLQPELLGAFVGVGGVLVVYVVALAYGTLTGKP